jgi:hypothetical protein
MVAALALSACGSSSKSGGSTSAGTAATAAARATGGADQSITSRFSALSECLRKQGITLPQRRSGTTGGFFGGGHFELPSGVTPAQLAAAMKKCGAPSLASSGGQPSLANPAFRTNLTRFAACMRESGVPLPAPNTSGSGSIFNTARLDTSSPHFRAAFAKCHGILRPPTRAPGGTGTTGGG